MVFCCNEVTFQFLLHSDCVRVEEAPIAKKVNVRYVSLLSSEIKTRLNIDTYAFFKDWLNVCQNVIAIYAVCLKGHCHTLQLFFIFDSVNWFQMAEYFSTKHTKQILLMSP